MTLARVKVVNDILLPRVFSLFHAWLALEALGKLPKSEELSKLKFFSSECTKLPAEILCP